MSDQVVCSICGRRFTEHGLPIHTWRVHGDGVGFKPYAGKVGWSKGLTKETSESIRKQAQAITRPRTELELKLDDDGKLYQRYADKRVNAQHEGIDCKLSYDEYCRLVDEAHLKSSQLGFSGQNYVLARYNDEGPYAYGNCRFITQKENMRERVLSDANIAICRQNAKHMNDCNKIRRESDPVAWGQRIREGQLKSEKMKVKRSRAAVHKQAHIADLNPSYAGANNSQYGTFWITDGVNNRKWSEAKGSIPLGYHRGRVV